jgi:signal transduction histidine kinase
MILNLVGNAIKHTKKGFIKIKLDKIEDEELFIYD